MTAPVETKTEATHAAANAVRARIEDARDTAGHIGSAVANGGKAYVAGVLELGRTLGGFGREVLAEAGQHVRATTRAKSLREVGELQAAWAQHRLEMSATHSKEFVELARHKAEEVIAPFAALIKQDGKNA